MNATLTTSLRSTREGWFGDGVTHLLGIFGTVLQEEQLVETTGE